MSQWVNGSVDGSMGRMGPGSMGQWVMGLGYDGSDGSWVTNGDPWSTLLKFTQHAYLRRMLLDTGTKKLLFIHPIDLFWGTGTTRSLGL